MKKWLIAVPNQDMYKMSLEHRVTAERLSKTDKAVSGEQRSHL